MIAGVIINDNSYYNSIKQVNPRRRTVEMYASAVIAFTHLYTYDLDLWPMTLKIFSAISTQMMNISVKFDWNPPLSKEISSDVVLESNSALNQPINQSIFVY